MNTQRQDSANTLLGSPSSSPSPVRKDMIPRVSYNLREHKKGIIITWSILLLTSGILPIVLYFALRYGSTLSLTYVLTVTTVVFGVFSVFSLCMRTYQLAKKDSACRPLGASRWNFDYFHWNFIFGFVVITIIIVIGNIYLSVRTTAFGLPFLLVLVTAQCLLAAVFHSLGWRMPFRMSSTAAHEPVRSGVYVIAEDVVGVDGHQGQTFRRELAARYEASVTVRRLCWWLDIMWGISGCLVGGGLIAILYAVPNENVAYTLGWAIPWAYAGIMTVVTLVTCKKMLKNEESEVHGNTSIEK